MECDVIIEFAICDCGPWSAGHIVSERVVSECISCILSVRCTLSLCMVWLTDHIRIFSISRSVFRIFNTRLNTTFGVCLLWCLCALYTKISIISISVWCGSRTFMCSFLFPYCTRCMCTEIDYWIEPHAMSRALDCCPLIDSFSRYISRLFSSPGSCQRGEHVYGYGSWRWE